MTDSRTNYGQQIDNLIRGAYGSKIKVFDQTIPRSVRAVIKQLALFLAALSATKQIQQSQGDFRIRSYQTKNQGCDPSEYLSQKWAFSIVDKCIVLEDDDVPMDILLAPTP